MKKKLLSMMLVVSMMSGILAGCGGGGETAETGTDEKIVLTVFDAHAYGLDEYAEMAAKFEEEHPGVTIEVQHAANDSAALLQSRVNADDIPDVFAVESGTNAQKYYEYAYNWNDDKDVLDLFQPDSLAGGTDKDGNVMSLPWTYENAGLLYNKDLFEQAGINELPKTLDELEAACQKLEKIGVIPFALAAKDAWVMGQLSTHFMMDKALDAEGVTAGLTDGTLTFDKLKNFHNLFRFIDLAKKYGTDKPLETDWEISENMLANNQAAIISMGDWCQSNLDSFNPDANIGFLPFPVSDNPEDVTILSSCNWTYIVNKNSKNLELAKEYAEYILTSEMGQYWMCEGVGAVPAVITDHEIKGDLANDAKAYVENGETNGWIHTKGPAGFSQSAGPYVQAYMTGDMNEDEVIQQFQTLWTP